MNVTLVQIITFSGILICRLALDPFSLTFSLKCHEEGKFQAPKVFSLLVLRGSTFTASSQYANVIWRYGQNQAGGSQGARVGFLWVRYSFFYIRTVSIFHLDRFNVGNLWVDCLLKAPYARHFTRHSAEIWCESRFFGTLRIMQ